MVLAQAVEAPSTVLSTGSNFAVGVSSDHQPIEPTRKLDLQAPRGRHLLVVGEAIGIGRVKGDAKGAMIEARHC